MDAKIPVYVITGFLGAGKTTLLNALLRHDGMADTAVVINEFGDVGLDHLIVETAFEDAVLLKSGCICCTVRGDLVDTLALLRARVSMGQIPDYARVLIETTGLADPGPVLQTLMTEPTVAARHVVGGVITVVDAVHGAGELDRRREPARQIAVADTIVLSKTDLAAADQRAALVARIRGLNPGAPILDTAAGPIAPSALMRSAFRESSGPEDVAAWLGDEHDGHNGHGAHHHDHDDGVHAVCLRRDAPVPWNALVRFVQSVLSIRGADVLRLKGLARVAGVDRPVMLHGVHHLLHPPILLDAWPDGRPETQIVFICTADIGHNDLDAALAASVAAGENDNANL
jgi:G3E family GTPase